MNLRRSILCLFWAVSITFGAQSFTHSPTEVTTSELVLRSHAIYEARPRYPEDAITHRIAGVAVAKVTVSLQGHVQHVQILEAPSPSLARETASAVQRWRFLPWPENQLTITGKLTFYFLLHGDHGTVMSPSEIDGLVIFHQDRAAPVAAKGIGHDTTLKPNQERR